MISRQQGASNNHQQLSIISLVDWDSSLAFVIDNLIPKSQLNGRAQVSFLGSLEAEPSQYCVRSCDCRGRNDETYEEEREKVR